MFVFTFVLSVCLFSLVDPGNGAPAGIPVLTSNATNGQITLGHTYTLNCQFAGHPPAHAYTIDFEYDENSIGDFYFPGKTSRRERSVAVV